MAHGAERGLGPSPRDRILCVSPEASPFAFRIQDTSLERPWG
jgi:hypothetical protein